MRGELTNDMYALVPEIDFHAGSRFFLGNTSNYARALMATLKSMKSKLPLLHTMCLSEEYEGLRTITQTLQKMFRNIGAAALMEESYELEKALFEADRTGLTMQLSDYMLHLMELSDHLEALFRRMETQNSSQEERSSSFLNYDFSKTKESIRQSTDLIERKII